MSDQYPQEFLRKLRELLASHFNEEELKTLAADLGIEFDDLPGNGRIGKIRELISYVVRRNQLDDLVCGARVARRMVDWPSVPEPIPDAEPEEKKRFAFLPASWSSTWVSIAIIFVSICGIFWSVIFILERRASAAAPVQPLVQATFVATQRPPEPTSTPVRFTTQPTGFPTMTPTSSPALDLNSIVFTSARHGDWEIYSMRPDGSNVVQLTNGYGQSWGPSLSPDGNLIAFASDRTDNNELYLMNKDGSGIRQLTDTASSEWFPEWSPDGSHLVFYTDRDGGDREVYIMDVAGTNIRRLTNANGNDWYPSWSPDGKTIAFTSERDGTAAIYLYDVADGFSRRVTEDDMKSWIPAWSPAGGKIAFHSDKDGDFELYILHVQTGDIEQITNNGVDDMFANWSPDGRNLVFHSVRGGERDVYKIHLLTRIETRLTFDTKVSDQWADW